MAKGSSFFGLYVSDEENKSYNKVWSSDLLTNIRLGWKGLLVANVVACLASTSAMKEKSFIRMRPSVNVIKLFSFITDDKA
jgi:hypothetical protein